MRSFTLFGAIKISDPIDPQTAASAVA